MRITTTLALAFASTALGLAAPASAIINSPLPSNAYITFGGLDWAWASPCSAGPDSCGQVDLSYQSTQGWRLPTAADFASGIQASDFLFAGANVPGGGTSAEGTYFEGTSSAGACASAYFDIYQNHCDYSDGAQHIVYNDPQTPARQGAEDTWVVRSISSAVPEPASWAMMIGGVGFAGGMVRRRRGKVATTARYA